MIALTLHAALALAARCDLAEGPIWDAQRGRLHFVDITPGRIHTWDPATGARRAIDCGAMAGCVVPRRGGGLIAALADGVWAVDADSGEKHFLVSPAEHDPTRGRFNDGKCDPQGRLWAGTMGLNGERGIGALYSFDAAPSSRCHLRDVSISNGLAWSLDGWTLYYIDSPTRRVDAFDFDPDSGTIGNRRTAITLPAGTDVPDGCTLDAEGNLWIAHWGGGCVTRWNPKTSEHLATVRVPAPHPTSCAFGGAKHDTLYITTARRGLDAGQLAAFPESGGIFACQPAVSGQPASAFAG